MNLFANYKPQRQAFSSLLESECRNRILLIRGNSGTGKTMLIMTCQKDVCAPFCIPIQLRGTSVSIAEIFSRTVGRLGRESLPRFAKQVQGLSGVNVNIDSNSMKGFNNQISVALHHENPQTREERRVSLTDAWFEDVSEINHIVLMVLDTFEKASPEVKEWINGALLPRAVNTSNIRIVIAGQNVPDHRQAIDWGHCCEFHELKGVWEAHHWLPVVQDMKRKVMEPASVYLTGICQVLEGRPDAIMNFIEKLPTL